MRLDGMIALATANLHWGLAIPFFVAAGLILAAAGLSKWVSVKVTEEFDKVWLRLTANQPSIPTSPWSNLSVKKDDFTNIAAWAVDAGGAFVGAAGLASSIILIADQVHVAGWPIVEIVVVCALIGVVIRLYSVSPSKYGWPLLSWLQGVLFCGNVLAGVVVLVH